MADWKLDRQTAYVPDGTPDRTDFAVVTERRAGPIGGVSEPHSREACAIL